MKILVSILVILVSVIYLTDLDAEHTAFTVELPPMSITDNDDYRAHKHCICEIGVMLRHEDGTVRCTNCGRRE
jgi:hypothetical protein